MTEILPLTTQSDEAIEQLLDRAFGTDRHGRTAYRIREAMPWLPRLSYAAVEGGALVGTLQSWPIALHAPDGNTHNLIMVGPVAVVPERQRGGFGRAMMDALVRDARSLRCEPLMMIGDPEYYGRFWGFTADHTSGWQLPGTFEPRRLLALSVDGRDIPAEGMLGPRVTVTA